MDAHQIRSAVEAVLASVAPDVDMRGLRPDQPLREQLSLDSMDWLNVVTALHDRLAIDIPESDYDKVATLDAIVAYLGSRRRRHPPHALRATAPAPGDLPCERHEINGTPVTIRPIRHDDMPLEADFVRHLSDDSRYMRFMSTIRELPPGKLKYLVDVDHVRHVALVAVTEAEGKPVEVGVVRYIVDPNGQDCEFSVAIDDAWHHTGLAGILMAALMDVARKRGLARMEGIVLATNASMLRFARQLGFTLEHDPDDRTTMHVVCALQPAAAKIRVLPLTPARWPDLEAVFEAKGCSVARGCWCMYYRETGTPKALAGKNLAQSRKKRMRDRAAKGPPPGLIAYAGKQAVGWVTLGPREEFLKLRRSPVMKPVDDKPVWSIVCFVVPPEHRHKGVATALLRGAIAYAAKKGVTLLEAYPIDKAKRGADDWLWHGAKSMYDKAGFAEVARRKPERPVVRLALPAKRRKAAT